MTTVPSVLIVDDDGSVAGALVRHLLRECNVRCVLAPDGIAAFNLLCQEPFDLLVTDMAMAGMTGLTLLEHCKYRWPAMRRVLFTGYSDASVVVENEQNADAVIGKTLDIETIRKTICRLAMTPREGDETAASNAAKSAESGEVSSGTKAK